MLVDLGPTEDFQDGKIRIVMANSRELGVIKVGEIYFAFRNICAHQGGPIGRGAVVRAVTCDAVGEPLVERDQVVIACPWHHWEFELPSGTARHDRHYRLKTYPTTVASGRVVANLRPLKVGASSSDQKRH